MSEYRECLVCFANCNIMRSDIDPYACKCKYPIHRCCYDVWKKHGTSRLCLICRITENQYIRARIEYEEFQRKKICLVIFIIVCYIILIPFIF